MLNRNLNKKLVIPIVILWLHKVKPDYLLVLSFFYMERVLQDYYCSNINIKLVGVFCISISEDTFRKTEISIRSMQVFSATTPCPARPHIPVIPGYFKRQLGYHYYTKVSGFQK